MIALSPAEQRQTVLLGRELFEEIHKFRHLDSIFIANNQCTKEI